MTSTGYSALPGPDGSAIGPPLTRPNPAGLDAFLQPLGQPKLRSINLRTTTIPKGTFRHEIMARSKYVQVCGRFRSYEDFPSANPLANECDVSQSEKPERDPPLLTNSRAKTTVDEILAFAQTHAPGRTLDLAFNSEVANKVKVSAPRMMGAKVVQEDIEPVVSLPSSDAFCKLPSQRKREHEQELAQLRAEAFLREARKKHNIVHKRLSHLHRSGFLGSGEGETPEQAHNRQMLEKHKAMMAKRSQFIVDNDHKTLPARLTDPEAAPPSPGKALPQSPPEVMLQRKRHGIGPPDSFTVSKMMADTSFKLQPNRMAKLVFQDGRARGFDIISGVVDNRVASCPYQD